MSEWSDWIGHDGGPCPVPIGAYVQSKQHGRRGVFDGLGGLLTPALAACPAWVMPDHLGPWAKIIAYRIRKPRGLTILENLIADIPAPVGQKVDA